MKNDKDGDQIEDQDQNEIYSRILKVTLELARLSSPAVLHVTIYINVHRSVVASMTLTYIIEFEHAYLERIDYE